MTDPCARCDSLNRLYGVEGLPPLLCYECNHANAPTSNTLFWILVLLLASCAAGGALAWFG